jgi:prolyl-tRNA synthetase
MRWSQMFIPTLREDPADIEIVSHRLLIRAGYVKPLMAGVYNLLPLGQRVRLKIIEIIRQEMNNIGGQEFLLSALQPLELWQESGRLTAVADIMFQLQDRKGFKLTLGLSHEEVFTSIARSGGLLSYKQLPQTWYQIQTKFRDEARPRGGLLRTREFTMKDSYSFDLDQASLDKSFQRHHDAYKRIFDRCGLGCKAIEADNGAMGGSGSVEFTALTSVGEDTVVLCSKCDYAANLEKAESRNKVLTQAVQDGEECVKCGGKLRFTNGVEVGHIFKLGTRYSDSMNANILGCDGDRKPLFMGCYGIGVERLLASVAEVWHDKGGLRWPLSIAPFAVLIVPVNAKNAGQIATAEQIYALLKSHDIDCLLDDRDERAGVKFKDADLIGVPFRIIVGKKIELGEVELIDRINGTPLNIKVTEIAEVIKNVLKNYEARTL